MDKQSHTIISIFKDDTIISISLGHAYKDLAGNMLGLLASFVKLFLHTPFGGENGKLFSLASQPTSIHLGIQIDGT
jgi:hypothetical protein